MRNETFEQAVTKILKKDATYPRAAYGLLTAALDCELADLAVDFIAPAVGQCVPHGCV